MFRTRRNSLVKRLWKSRLKAQDEANGATENPEHSEEKSVIHSMLKRLKEKQLEVLVQSVESRGVEGGECVVLPRADQRFARRTVPTHVLCCHVWRWPDLGDHSELKRLSNCNSPAEHTSVCCNPYHWSRVVVPDSPPPPYTTAIIERVLSKDGPLVDSEGTTVVSTETGLAPPAYRNYTGSLTNGCGPEFWCNVAYWEQRQRVGRLFTVVKPSVNVFQELTHGDGMCLGVLQQHTNTESVRRTREKIGQGVVLSKEPDGVWAYNRSDFAIFVNSPTLDIPNSQMTVVIKVPPGYSIKIFDYERSEALQRTRDPQYLDGPYDPNAVRISFAKGWGPTYSRQFITSCPCWLEVLLSVNR